MLCCCWTTIQLSGIIYGKGIHSVAWLWWGWKVSQSTRLLPWYEESRTAKGSFLPVFEKGFGDGHCVFITKWHCTLTCTNPSATGDLTLGTLCWAVVAETQPITLEIQRVFQKQVTFHAPGVVSIWLCTCLKKTLQTSESTDHRSLLAFPESSSVTQTTSISPLSVF